MRVKQVALAIGVFALSALAITFYRNQYARRLIGGTLKSPETNLASTANRTNILLLGIGGEGHAGSKLTDSIMLVSLDLSSKIPTLISLPRDIWVNSLAAKINTAYYYGEEKEKGSGLSAAKAAVSELTGLTVHYGLVLDFAGFTKAIDAVGGIDLVVDNAFDDFKYPIPGKETAEPESARYEHIHFDAGATHMDGATALKFVRSRHAEGDEGTDFARSLRQQKVINAFRQKIFSTSTLFNQQALSSLKSSIESSVITDISESEYGSFVRIFMTIAHDQSIKRLDFESQFTNPKNTKPYGGQWVLTPKTNLEELYAYVQTELNSQ